MDLTLPSEGEEPAGRGKFFWWMPATISHSLLRAAMAKEERARNDLLTICSRPVGRLLLHRGCPVNDVEDVKAAILDKLWHDEKEVLSRFDRSRGSGSFRAFLDTLVKHGLIQHYRYHGAEKRGGGARIIPFEMWEDQEAELRKEGGDPVASPADVAMAAETHLTACERMASARRGNAAKEAVFRALKPYFLTDKSPPFQELATRLATTAAALSQNFFRMRHQYGACFTDAVRPTVRDPSELGEEVRFRLKVCYRHQGTPGFD